MVDKHNPFWFNNCTQKSTILSFYHPGRKARHRWEGHRISALSCVGDRPPNGRDSGQKGLSGAHHATER